MNEQQLQEVNERTADAYIAGVSQALSDLGYGEEAIKQAAVVLLDPNEGLLEKRASANEKKAALAETILQDIQALSK